MEAYREHKCWCGNCGAHQERIVERSDSEAIAALARRLGVTEADLISDETEIGR